MKKILVVLSLVLASNASGALPKANPKLSAPSVTPKAFALPEGTVVGVYDSPDPEEYSVGTVVGGRIKFVLRSGKVMWANMTYLNKYHWFLIFTF